MKIDFLRNKFSLLLMSLIVLFIVNNYIVTNDDLRYILLFIELMGGLWLYRESFLAIVLIGLFWFWHLHIFHNEMKKKEEAMLFRESNKTVATIWRIYKENDYYHILLSNEYFMSEYEV